MATRPKGYGMTAELTDKRDAKYDPKMELSATVWIEDVLGEPISEGPRSPGMMNFGNALKDGVVLCKLMNKLQPGSIKKIQSSKSPFKMMENIGNFIAAAESYGTKKVDLFQTVDLYELQNVGAVVDTIHALGRTALRNEFSGPSLGLKESTVNVREFTEEQRREGQNVIGLQMGTNKLASQAGDHYGRPRQITDAYK